MNVIQSLKIAINQQGKKGFFPRITLGSWMLFWILFVMGILGKTVWADQLLMKNGDQLQGQVLSMSGEKLTFKTTYAGELQIDWNEVAQIVIDGPMEFGLMDGTKLQGRAMTGEGGVFQVQEEETGAEISVPFSQVVDFQPPQPPETWKLNARIGLGASKYSGNTNTEGYNVDGELTLDKAPHALKFYAEYFREKDDGTLSKDKGLGSANYNRFVSERIYLFGNALAARDRLKDLTFQTSGALGAGYQVWKSDEKNLSFSLGPSYVYEKYTRPMVNFDNKDYREYAAAFWAVDFDLWLFKKSLQFFHNDSGYFDLRGGGNWQIRTRTGVRVPLVYGLFTSLQYNYDFVNIPADGKKQADQAYLLKLGWKW